MTDKRYKSFGHAKTRLRYHLIFSTKYRTTCLLGIEDQVKAAFHAAEKVSHFRILEMEIDRNHIHFLVEIPPKYSIEQTVRRLKQFSTNTLYREIPGHFRRFYRKRRHVLWTGGYFCSTIGNVSEAKVVDYIRNQG